jgi:hypothetical protein
MIPESQKSQFLKSVPSVSILKNDVATKVIGFVPNSSQDYNIPLIRDLLELPLEEVTMKYVINHPSNRDRQYV